MDTVLTGSGPVVPGVSIAAMWFTFFVTAILPFLIWVAMARKWRHMSLAVLAGALGFFFPQILIRMPLLSTPSIAQTLGDLYVWNPLAYFLTLAFTAALFETSGRLFVFKSLLKNRLSYRTGVSAGYGHGVVEAFVLIGITYINNLIISYGVNAGTLDTSQDLLAQAAAQLAAVPAPLFLAAGFERMGTICFHVAVSVFLCYMMEKGQTGKGFLIALAAHTTLDFFVPLVQVKTGSYVLTEGIVLVVATVCVIFILSLKDKFKVVEIPVDPAKEAAEEGY